MLKFTDLLFNKWILSAIETLIKPNVAPKSSYLQDKLWKAKFLNFCELNVINTYAYWLKSGNLFLNFPAAWGPNYYERYLETTPKERRWVDDSDLEPLERVVLRAFSDTKMFWIYLPIFLSDFFKYYPYYKPAPLIFGEPEFTFLDCWIQILPVFEDFLGHLLVNDTPLNQKGAYGNGLFPLSLYPPIEKDIDFSEHIHEYFFGDASYPEFKDVINLYLNNRLHLKTKCLNSFNIDKQLNNQIPDDLAVYFISHFLIKGISKYALRFVVANLDLSSKNPMKAERDAYAKEWNSFSEEEKKRYWPAGWLAEQKKS